MRERSEIEVDRDLKFSFKSYANEINFLAAHLGEAEADRFALDRFALQIDTLLREAAGQYRAARRAAYNRGAHEHLIQCFACRKFLTAKSAKRRYCPGNRCRDTDMKRLQRYAEMVRRIETDLEKARQEEAERRAMEISSQLALLRDRRTALKLDGATLWDKVNRQRELIEAREKSVLTADEFWGQNLSPTEKRRITAR